MTDQPLKPDLVIPASAEHYDRDLVDQAAQEIQAILVRTVNRGVDEIGRCLLRTFFDDDPELYFSISPTKHVSLTKLAERCQSLGLPVRRTFLANALRLAAVAKKMPRSATFHRLPPGHRIELLRLREPERIEKLAARVETHSLNVERTRGLVLKEWERTKSTRGRKPVPPLIKALEAGARGLRDADTNRLAFSKADVHALTPEQEERARVAFRELEKRLAELRRLFE